MSFDWLVVLVLHEVVPLELMVADGLELTLKLRAQYQLLLLE